MAGSPTQSAVQSSDSPWSAQHRPLPGAADRLGRQQVRLGHLMQACAWHASGWLFLLYAAARGLLQWGALGAMVAGSVAAYGLLVWVRREGRPRHRFDPGLFGPLTAMTLVTLLGIGCLVDAAGAGAVVAALTPVQIVVACRLRRRQMRRYFGLSCWLAGAGLLAWGLHGKAGLTELVLAAAVLMAGAAALAWRGQLQVLKAQALVPWVVSDDKTQSVFIGRLLVGVVNALAGVAALNYGVYAGVIDSVPTFWFTVAALCTTASVYLAQRTGWSKRLADPGLTEPQLVAMISFIAGGYYYAGLGSGVALMLLVTVQVFGMFAISPLQVARTSVVEVVLMGAAMLAVAWQARDVHIRQLQAVHFVVMVVILVSVSWLAHQLARLRGALVKRKNDLTEALTRIEVLASRDELTGLFNRRRMLEILQTHVCLHARDARPFCVAVIDMDHFKRVNDQHGHGVGDELLRRFAQAMQNSFREIDVVARWGGEEFLVLLVGVRSPDAYLSLERARMAFAYLGEASAQPGMRATFSCGLTEYRAGEGIEHTIDRADQALYRAKAAGRNRTEVIVSDAPQMSPVEVDVPGRPVPA